jgi:hypothetical protein
LNGAITSEHLQIVSIELSVERVMEKYDRLSWERCQCSRGKAAHSVDFSKVKKPAYGRAKKIAPKDDEVGISRWTGRKQYLVYSSWLGYPYSKLLHH